MPIPEWLKEHRELQMLRAASSVGNHRNRRRKKKRTKVPKSYFKERAEKYDNG